MQMTHSGYFLFFSIIFVLVLVLLGTFYFLRKRRALVPLAERQIYVGNVSYRTDNDTLRKYFLQYGSIERVHVVKNRHTGRSKGYAFVTFKELAGAQRALAANGQTFLERVLVVHMARPR